MKKYFLSLFLLLTTSFTSVHAFELETQKVTDNIYALVGEIGPRTKENMGLNNTLGFVITDKGVVLVSSGATPDGAKLLAETIKKTTDKPIIQVVNVGAQDHHWMGNSWFLKNKIPVMALARTVATQKEYVSSHQQRLAQGLGGKPEDFSYAHADAVIDADKHAFSMGGVDFELLYLGDGHFPGDAVLWLPKQKVVFSGDIVYNERTLGIQPSSKLLAWKKTFDKLAELKPEHVIPGHGYAGDLAKAQKNTGDYLNWLVEEVGKAVEEMEDLGDVVLRLTKDSPFKHLKFHESWDSTNINRSYLQLESQ